VQPAADNIEFDCPCPQLPMAKLLRGPTASCREESLGANAWTLRKRKLSGLRTIHHAGLYRELIRTGRPSEAQPCSVTTNSPCFVVDDSPALEFSRVKPVAIL
jgi:hypothetical protein